ncbi:Protein TOXD [Cercospora beticola]|uniref:Protein TOXD n=1 Tax=Cercospora beticola TaxID=122368 RepID=A0A2G5HMU8_CERBT|nr:Protein TOXD [Cercospora beticola]PIA93879.1 Protein TOXD [Cercospora beticola]WPB02485.1 hypothetical protein RHO25_007121 [Cercospora beticola]
MSNQSLYLDAPGQLLRLASSSIPQPGPDELIIETKALSINPIDVAQSTKGLYLKSFPRILGQDVSGIVHSIGTQGNSPFSTGDRVTAHAWSMLTGQNEDAAWQKYVRVKAKNTAKLPNKISFAESVVLPLVLNTAAAGLYQTLQLPLPEVGKKRTGEGVLVVYGGSSAVGLSVTQLATASGVRVIAIASEKNFELVKEVGAEEVFDQKQGDEMVEKVVKAVTATKEKFIGVFDAIAVEATYKHDLAILEKLEGGAFVSTHQLPEDLPENVKGKFIFGLGEFSFALWENYIPQALESGDLKIRPEPLVVGKGLESIEKALEVYQKGVSGKKVVVEL